MTDTDPNRLGPVTREWVAALERRIEELEAKYERLETIASMQPEPQHGDVRVGTAANVMSDEASATVTSSATPPEIEWWDERDLLLGDLMVARREIDRLRAQLAARPVAAATDEQLMDVVGMMNAAARSMDAVVMLRSWLSTLGDKNGGAR